MKTLCIISAILSLTLCATYAATTGTVTRAVITDTNGVLTGPSTNFASVNGLSGTGSVADVIANLGAVSNLAVSGIASAAVAQATADAATETNVALDARLVSVETNHATAAQGALADSAVQPDALGGYVETNDPSLTDARVPLTHDQPLSSITNAGTAAASNANAFATAAQGSLADTALQSDGMGSNLAAIVTLTGQNTNIIYVTGAGTEGANGTYYYGATMDPPLSGETFWTNAAGYVLRASQASPQLMSPVFLDELYYSATPGISGPWDLGGSGFGTNPAPTMAYDMTAPVVKRVEEISRTALAALSTNGSGANLTGITAAQVRAIPVEAATWRTNDVLGIDGTTNTIIYLGLP